MTSTIKRPSAEAANSNIEWKAWGEKDPLFGVIPLTGREHDGANPWTSEDFYETGKSDWADFRARWQNYGLNLETCVEIGCGAGRLTKQMAADFSHVHGLDVAEGMIAYARPHMPANVSLHVTEGVSLPLPDQSATAVFSVIVFLHFDHPGIAASYFREMARVLKPGGTVMIQLPIHFWPTNVKPGMRGLFGFLQDRYMGLRRLKAVYHRFLLTRKTWSPFMQSLSYDSVWLRDTLTGLGFQQTEFCVFEVSRGGVPYSWVLARKA